MKYRHGLIVSLMLHLLLFFSFIKITWVKNQEAIGTPKARIISTYLFMPKQKQSLFIEKQSKSHHSLMANSSIGTIPTALNTSHSYATKNPKEAADFNKGYDNPLLTVLHNIIALALRYPEQAQLLNEHGTVLIGFTIMPSGKVENIRVLKSSGYPLLDHAAIDTLQNINPFKAIQLTKTQQFKLSMSFG